MEEVCPCKEADDERNPDFKCARAFPCVYAVHRGGKQQGKEQQHREVGRGTLNVEPMTPDCGGKEQDNEQGREQQKERALQDPAVVRVDGDDQRRRGKEENNNPLLKTSLCSSSLLSS
jgi:hypothetical protein